MATENERELAQLERTAAAALAESPRYLLVAQVDGIAPSGAFQPRGLRLLGPVADLVDAVHVAAGLLEAEGIVAGANGDTRTSEMYQRAADRLREAFKAATTPPAPEPPPPTPAPAGPGTA